MFYLNNICSNKINFSGNFIYLKAVKNVSKFFLDNNLYKYLKMKEIYHGIISNLSLNI